MKDLFRKSKSVSKNQFLKWKQDYRVWLVFLLVTAVIVFYLKGIVSYGLTFQKKCTPWVLALMFSDASVANGLLKIQVYFGAVLLFCNAPFTDLQSQYIVTRSGRRAWSIGNILYLLSAALVYTVFLAAVSMAVVIPVTGWTRNWGSVFASLLEESPQIQFEYLGELVLPDILIRTVYPAAAQAYTLIAGWLSFSVMGLLIYLLNLVSGHYLTGVAGAVFFILLDPVVRWMAFVETRFYWYYLSPVSWSSIEHWDFLGKDRPLHAETVLSLSFMLLILLTLLIILAERNREVKTVSAE